MTTVHISLGRDDGTDQTAAKGVVEWEPTTRREDGTMVILERGFTVPLVDGEATVTVDPSGLTWCWRVTERTDSGGTVRYVSVPDSAAVVEYVDLPDVDPTTLVPWTPADPEAAYQTALENLDVETAVENYLLANPVSAPVDSVNGQTGAVALGAADVGADPAGTAAGLVGALTPASIGAATPAQVSSGDSATLAAAQSHAQGLVDALKAASPATLDTLAEIATALGEDPNFAATITTALANRVRFDAAQSLSVPQQDQARTNIGAAPALGSDDNYVTDAEKAALHSHANKTALDAVSGTNTGDQDLSGLVPTSRTVAGKALSSDITIGAADLSATGTKDGTTVLHGDNTWKVPAGDGGSDPWTYVVATADTDSGTTGAAVNIDGLAIPALADGLYEFHCLIIGRALSTGAGVQPGIIAPAGCTVTPMAIGPNSNPSLNQAWTKPGIQFVDAAFVFNSLDAPSATVPFAALDMHAVLRAASMTNPLLFTIKSEISGGGTNAYAKADSFVRYRRIAD